MTEVKKRIMAKVLALLGESRMTVRDGDKYHTRKRPPCGFTACEIYGDARLGLTEGDTFRTLNRMVDVGELKLDGLVYYLK